jgi:hypothetical protein
VFFCAGTVISCTAGDHARHAAAQRDQCKPCQGIFAIGALSSFQGFQAFFVQYPWWVPLVSRAPAWINLRQNTVFLYSILVRHELAVATFPADHAR